MAAAAEALDIDASADAGTEGKVPFYKTAMGKNIIRGGAVAAILITILMIWLWNKEPDYKVLFSNFSDRDGGAITAALDQMQVPYKFSEGGNAILIPAEKVHDTRLRLASQGLPKGGNVGFELMENQKLGVSQFLEQVNYQRALEGEMAKSIESLGAVQSARVHLAMPKPSVFVREQQKPTASVILTLHPNRAIDPGQVSAVVHLVASSVPELQPANVTVVDQQGNLLSDQNKNSNTAIKSLDATQLKYVQELQNQVIKQVENIVKPIVGEGNVRAEAVADVDFSAVEQAAESYKPNSSPAPSAIRSQQSSETNGNTNANPNGVPGALSNQPPGVATAPLTTTPPGEAPAPGTVPGGTAAAGTGPMHKESTTNYEVDKTVRYEQKAIAGLKRMTVGVVVNYRRIVGPDGKVTVRPLNADELAKINSLVREAMGYNQDRGDSVSVANAPFDGVDKAAEPALDWWRDPANLPMAKELAKFLITALILLYILMRVVRPMMRPVFKKIDEINAPEPEPEPEIIEEPTGPTEEEIFAQQMAEMEESTARTYRDNLALAKKLAAEDPRIVANVIKAWIEAND
ncbi:flagellar basal-body MS-ring/collar protein FliF [Pseudoduganella plicata]|uniref:Flagellar M-ring protein n=1 Tax=Pseudoduganella plicata TaxID=321984 RepID=A0A4P7BCM5_9BURK|nr:flagellar basal-body MS-ring/collar protein FliF [Pseudoduganella plicata]QBQ36416.1 flagellar basal body M-ring protein FliF [Pseudoduganella plicata]GGY77108.1 flagellar M-ring protein [Pseudoduganella plicata]